MEKKAKKKPFLILGLPSESKIVQDQWILRPEVKIAQKQWNSKM